MSEARLVEVVADGFRRGRAQAEFREWEFIAAEHARRTAAVDRVDEVPIGRELARREVTLELAKAFTVSENRIWAMVSEAEVLQARTPGVWAAFAAGDIDAVRVAAIASTADQLTTRRAWTVLENTAPAYAATHTVSELRAWLRRLKARLEAAPDRTKAALEQRRVAIHHQDDGTSWFSVLLPTGVAIAVGNRLRTAAKALPAVDPDTGENDTRTRDQKQADLVAHWLTTSEGTSTDIRAEIAIAIDAADLLGHTDGPGIVRGDGEPLDNAWVRELAASEHTILRRLVLDPIGGVLDTTVLSYRPPDSLRQALHWRDGTCRVVGCSAPVFETDLDHELAHDRGGPTSGANLRCLCRRHHNMPTPNKRAHGHLDDEFIAPPAIHREHYCGDPPLIIEYDTSGPKVA